MIKAKKDIDIVEVVRILNSRGWRLIKEPSGKYYEVEKFCSPYHPSPRKTYYSHRELYNLYKHYCLKGRVYKRIVKDLSKGKDRSCSRNLLRHEKYEDIPLNKRAKSEDVWFHD